MFSNFEKEAALEDSAFWCVLCLTHKVLISAYSLIKDLIDLAWWCVVEWVGQNRETDDCVEEGLQLARVKNDRDGEGSREALNMGNCRINIWDVSELELLAWSKKSNIPIFLLCGILNISICKMCDVLHWVYSLLTKNFSNIFCSTFS